MTENGAGVVLQTTAGPVRADRVVFCGGLQADRLARLAGIEPDFRIVPFRGEYYDVRPEKADLVSTLIYPIPDPELPFLGVHLTPTVTGGLNVGPNAVLGLAREGYAKYSFAWADVRDLATFPGMWRVARSNVRTGAREMKNSLSKRGYLKECRKYCPSLALDDLTPREAGIRAQAVMRDGSFVHDFLLRQTARTLHVINAPSPAATSALPIGEKLAGDGVRDGAELTQPRHIGRSVVSCCMAVTLNERSSRPSSTGRAGAAPACWWSTANPGWASPRCSRTPSSARRTRSCSAPSGLESEAPLAFAALHRLLRPVVDLIERIPAPQARALRVAFGQEEGRSVDPFLVSLATLSMLTEAGEASPVFCLVDDAQWLDVASADALLFTARRLQADPVAMIFAARDGDERRLPRPTASPRCRWAGSMRRRSGRCWRNAGVRGSPTTSVSGCAGRPGGTRWRWSSCRTG